MDNLKQDLLDEIPIFKETSLKFLNGEISKIQYKNFSSGYGVYFEEDQKTFTIKFRISSGVITKSQLNSIYQFAYKHHLDIINFSSNQTITLSGLSIDSTCDIMKNGIEKEIFTRGSGGNYPRNVTLSDLSGVNPDDVFDVTPYALATDKHFLSKIVTYNLPGELNVSFSSNYIPSNIYNIKDLCFVATKKNQENYFKVFIASMELSALIKPSDMLYLVEGLTNLFINEGDYSSNNTLTIQDLVKTIGEKYFLEKFTEYSIKEKEIGGLDYIPQPIDYYKIGFNIDIKHPRLFAQKQEGLYSVSICPKSSQLLTKDLKNLLYELDKIKKPMIRLSVDEGFFIVNLDGNEAKRILNISEKMCNNSYSI